MPELTSYNIQDIAQQFGVSFAHEPEKKISLAYVFILDGAWVLRGRKLTPTTQQRFNTELALLQKVKERIPYQLPSPRRAKNGEQYILAHDFFWTLYPLIPGRIVCDWWDVTRATDEETKRLLQILRDLHEKTNGLFERDHEDRFFFVREIEQRFERVQQLLPASDRHRLTRAMGIVRDYSSKKRKTCFVHGDFHFGNVLFDDQNDVAGLLDCDWCRVGSPLEDCAYTVMMLFRRYETEKFRFAPSCFQNFLQWYGIAKEDQKLFYEYLLLYALYDVDVLMTAENVPKRAQYLQYQISLVHDFCGRFSSE